MSSCIIISVILWVYCGFELALSPHDSEDIWLDVAISVVWTVAAIGLYIYWKRKKRKPE